MSKHTPGPWVHSIFNVCDGHGDRVANTGSMRRSVSECTANASLIAAAPELMDALKDEDALIVEAQRLLATWIVPDSGITDAQALNDLLGLFDGPEQRAAQAKAKAAIAKAEGAE